MDGPAHTDPSSTPGPGTLRPPAELARTLGELRASGWKSVPVAEEMRRNTMARIASGETLVPGVLGFDDTVIPQLENAILAGHDIILLGERGQAKTRVIRALVGLLDEWLPIVAGSEINDDPYHPVSRGAINTVDEHGDDTPITWVHRSQRYGEKLATPDTSIADLIGEVDPIKIAEGRYLSDELALHYGLIPRVNRGIFAINELPDLSERIQVGLLNVLEERDVQIRGHRIRLPLDITLVATANPEDYTNRGRIITPLKDRFGAQIRTHYPYDTMTEVKIMESEAELPTAGIPVTVPTYLKEVVAEVSQLARRSSHLNQRSGVSVRLSIANYETLVANSVRRALRTGRAGGRAPHQRPGLAGPLDPGQGRGRGHGGGSRARGGGPTGGRRHPGRLPAPGHPGRPGDHRRRLHRAGRGARRRRPALGGLPGRAGRHPRARAADPGPGRPGRGRVARP